MEIFSICKLVSLIVITFLYENLFVLHCFVNLIYNQLNLTNELVLNYKSCTWILNVFKLWRLIFPIIFLYYGSSIVNRYVIGTLCVSLMHFRLMFWTDWSQTSPRVMRAGMSGLDPKTIVTGAENGLLFWPNGMTKLLC